MVVVFLSVPLLQAQLSFKNQTEYSYWLDSKRNVWENWTDLTYQYDFVRAGLRFEINNPPDPYIFTQPYLVQKNELTYRFLEINYKWLSARIGNFYTTFGRGLILRSYENRDLRVDNNIDGMQLKIKNKGFNVQAFMGKMRDLYNRREEILYGFDTGYNLLSYFQIGGSILIQNHEENMENVWSLHTHFARQWWDLYLELAQPSWNNKFSTYAALSLTIGQFALTGEIKSYSDLFFENKYRIDYATAPVLCREHSYTLLNRHPHVLNMNDEKGYQVETIWFPDESWQVILNYSITQNQSSRRLFEEYYGEISFPTIIHNLEGVVAIDWKYDAATTTDNITLLTDVYYNLDSHNQVHFSLQHQHATNTNNKGEYDTELLLLEYSHSPWLTLALVGEYTNENQLRNVYLDRNTWFYGNVIFSFQGRHQLSILYGTRQEGFVCLGGVCRYEPEFMGIEIKLTNRF